MAKKPIKTDKPAADPSVVTPGQINQYRALRTTQHALTERYGADYTDEHVRLYILEKRAAKAQKRQIDASAKRQGLVPVGTKPTTFDERYREYELSFENLTPNDRTSLRTLVVLEMQIAQAQDDMLAQENVLNRAKIGDSITTMSREHRQLQDSMGISRAKRKNETNAQDEINRLRDGAQDFVERLGTPIRCTHCRSHFEMGLILFHFRDDVPWNFHFTCPKCQGQTTIEGVVVSTALEVPF